MLIQRNWRIAIEVPAAVRDEMLRRYPPKFTMLHGTTIDWHCNVEENPPFFSEPLIVTLYGLYTSVSSQVFAASFGASQTRADGKLLRLVYTTVPGLNPEHAGIFDQRQIVPLSAPVQFRASLSCIPMQARRPQVNYALAHA